MAGPTNARQHLREEPDALAAHVRICAGGPQQCGFLPRYALPLRVTLVLCDGASGRPAGGNPMGTAETESRRRFRSTRVEEMAEAVPGPVRARATRQRGRPARMHCRCGSLRFPAMGQPATLPAGTAWARPKQSPGAFAGPSRSRRWPRLCQNLCGRDARAPGWASSRDVIAAKEVHRSSCLSVELGEQAASD